MKSEPRSIPKIKEIPTSKIKEKTISKIEEKCKEQEDAINTRFYAKDLKPYTKTKIQTYELSLTEMYQKYILDQPNSKDIKKELNGKCLRCQKDGVQLTNAHVSIKRIDIIREVLSENPKEDDMHCLLNIVIKKHIEKNIEFEICCRSCNKLLED